MNHRSNDRSNTHKEGNTARMPQRAPAPAAKGKPDDYVKGLHKEVQDPKRQPSSRGGGGLEPSDAPVVLLHRRGRRDNNMLQDFDDEDTALAYAKENKLMIVFSEKKGDQLRLYYLPE